MLYYHSLLHPQIPNSTSTSVHQGLALFSYVLIAVVDIRGKHLKLLLRKLTYMTWSISKSTFFFLLISLSLDLLGEKSLEKLHLKILTCSLMKNVLKQLLVGKIQSRNRILFFIYLNWQKLVNSNKLGYKSKAVKWHKIVYYYFFGTGNGRSVLYCHGNLIQRKTENGAALRHNVKKKKKRKKYTDGKCFHQFD